MTPRASALGAPPTRLGYVYTPNGIIGACDKSPRPFMWTPKTAGANFEFSPTMKALEPFREQMGSLGNDVPKLKGAKMKSVTAYSHKSYLATVEDLLKLPRLPSVMNETAMSEFFK